MNKLWQTAALWFSICLIVACTTTTPRPAAPRDALDNTSTAASTNTLTITTNTEETTAPPLPATTTAVAPTISPTSLSETTTIIPDIETEDETVTWAGTADLIPLATTDFPGAGSIAAALSSDGTLYVALGINNYIYVARSTDDGLTFSEPVQVSDTQAALVIPVERPAIAASATGQVSVAWSSPALNGQIWHALSLDGGETFSPAVAISGAAATETILPRSTIDEASNPFVAWLANGTLRFTHLAAGTETFAAPHIVDEQTCECCHPQPLVDGSRLFIAYRNLEIDGSSGEHSRDIFLARSADGGQTFTEEVRVSDASWLINACPVSGPALAKHGETIYVSWMDGRNDIQGNFSHTDIWLATSADGGVSFSPNRRLNLNAGVYHNLPSLAVDSIGTVHAVWEALEPERDAIYYAQSADQGMTFTTPVALVDSTVGSGRRPGNTTLLVGTDGILYLSWIDTAGAHLASWSAGQE